MLLAAFASLRSPASKAFYDRKRAEGKRHNAAVICLARRRYDVILAMLKNASPYEPDRTASPSETPALAAWMTRTWGHPRGSCPLTPPLEADVIMSLLLGIEPRNP